jgi:hypothetical protein
VFSLSFQSQIKSVAITIRFSEPFNANKENPLHQRSAKRTRFIRVPTTTASRTSASVILVPKTSSRTSTISKISPISKIRVPKNSTFKNLKQDKFSVAEKIRHHPPPL